ncbi:MAG TPA: DUF11 domain-containing protein, partial [Acidovorax sp.]|nr:DUF11 domain-containing protein [Acidovorax sp.]
MSHRLTRAWTSACARWFAPPAPGGSARIAHPQAATQPSQPVVRRLRPLRWLLLAASLSAGAAFAQSADLVINHADSPDPGPAGGIFTYTLRIDNNGPNGATGVTLSDTIPAGSQFVDVTTTAGSCSEAGGVVDCALGNIPFNTN